MSRVSAAQFSLKRAVAVTDYPLISVKAFLGRITAPQNNAKRKGLVSSLNIRGNRGLGRLSDPPSVTQPREPKLREVK